MKNLLLMRHASASPAEPNQTDFDRPLSAAGQIDATRMGHWLRQQALLPDLVISSSARRAVQTAAAVIDATSFDGPWQPAPSLYEAAPAAYYALLQHVPAACGTALVVAHNPALEELLTALTGASHPLPPGALASVSLPLEAWSAFAPQVKGQLLHLGRPREIA